MSKITNKLKELAKKAQNDVKKEINKASNKVGGATEKVKKRVQNSKVGTTAKDAAMFAPLVPFVPAMRAAIKAKGVQPELAKHIKAVALQFGRVVLGIKPQNADAAGRSGAETKDGQEITKADVIVETATTGLGIATGAAKAYSGDPSGFKILIQSILNYFKFLKKKKESGQKLSKAEEEALNIAEKAADEISEYQKGEIMDKIQKLAIPLLVIAVVYYAFVKK
jgi:hypothetical protein